MIGRMSKTAGMPSTSKVGHSSCVEQRLGTGGDGVSCGGVGSLGCSFISAPFR